MGGGDAGDAPGTGTLSVHATLDETAQPAGPVARPLPEVDPGAYTVQGEHARGGLGRIVRARDERLERPVAIKELWRPGPSARRRFEREARITARLQHPSVVPIYEAGRWPSGEPFYAMKLVEGRTLRDAIDAAGDLDGRLALLPHVLAVAEAVAFAHSHRVIHRDLKPANVILGSFGETVVIDWGLARDLTAADDDEEGVHGTPAYMAPEQAAGDPVDERTDVWALGALAYHVLAGATPYARAADVLAAAREGRPAPVTARQPGVPSDLATIVAKAMARAPADRYAHAGELAADLRRFQTGQLVGAHAYSTWSLVARWARRHRLPLTLAAIFVATLAAVGVTAVRGIVRERNVADARRDELLLLQARGALEKDPTRTVAWLKVYLETGSDRDQVAPLAAEAYQRGVARHVFRGQRGNPFHAVFSPDGKRLATGHADGSVDLWDVTTGASLGHQQHDGWVRAIAFTPDGALVASAADDRLIMLWNPTTHEVRRCAGNTSSVTALAMSPDGKRVASLSDDGAIRIWDVARGSSTALLARDAMLIAWSPDGSTLASSEEGGALRLWTLDGRSRVFGEHPGGATRLVFAPDGLKLATGGSDGTIFLWPMRDGALMSLEGHRGSIEAISFLPDGGVASVARDGDLRLWDPRGAALATVTAGTELQALAVSHDGRLIAYGGQDGVVRVRDGDTQAVRELHGHGTAIYKLAFSPDGTMLASVGGEVRLWDMVSHEVIPTRVLAGHTDDVSAVAFSPDGATIATASRDRSVRLWSAGGELERELLGHEHMVYRVAFVPGGRWLASASLDRTVRLWDLAGGQARVLVGPTDGLWDLAVSPDGTRVAAAGMGPDVWIWTVDDVTGRPLRGHAGEVRSIAFSPDGARLASGGADRTVRLWDVATGEGRVLGSHEDQVERVVFSPSGKLVASAGREGRVRIWDLASGRARVLSAEQGALRHVAFSPDGATLASAGADGTVALWDLASGGHRLLRGHTKAVTHIIFSPDGARLASVSLDGMARLWDLAVAQTRLLSGHRGAVMRAAFSPDGTKLATASTDRTARVFSLPSRPLVPVELDALRAFLVETTSARVGPSDVLETPQDF